MVPTTGELLLLSMRTTNSLEADQRERGCDGHCYFHNYIFMAK